MRFYLLTISLFSLSSCGLLRQTTVQNNGNALSMAQAIEYNRQPRKFLEDISVTPEKTRVNFVAQVEQQTATTKGPLATNVAFSENSSITSDANRSSRLDASNATGLQLKYAQLMNVDATSLPSLSLLLALEDWHGTPYMWGGSTKRGIDCSAFTQTIFQSVYGVNLPRTSREQHKTTDRISLTELQEGDLVFFNTRGRGISHVGIYLGSNKFAHASSGHGVVISDMYDPYYSKRYLGAGRWKREMN